MRTMFACVIAAMVLAAGQAAASPGEEPWAPEGVEGFALVAQQAPAPAAPGDRLRRALNLSDEQARRVEQILTAHRTRTARLRIDLSRARLDAREAMLEATPDRARLDTLARRMGDLQGQLAAARFGLAVDLRAVLTPEQWSRFQGITMRLAQTRGRGRR